MKVQLVNRNTMQTELDFEVSIDKSRVEFTEKMCELRLRGVTDNLIERTEQQMILESMHSILDKHPRCFVVFS